MLQNRTDDCWKWQQLSKSNHVRDSIAKFLLRLLINKLVPCSSKKNLEFILRATSLIKQAMYNKAQRGKAIKSHLSSCSAIFFWSTEMYWPNWYMSMDKSQGTSYPAQPTIDRSLIRQTGWLTRFLMSMSLLVQMLKWKPYNMKQMTTVMSGFWQKMQSYKFAWRDVCETHGISDSPWCLAAFPSAADSKTCLCSEKQDGTRMVGEGRRDLS